MWRRLASNTVANLVVGLSALAFQLYVTGLATRHFPAADFSAWALAFSIASMTALFGFGLSSVVARLHADHSGTPHALLALMSLARRWSVGLSVLAMVVLAGVALVTHQVSSVPSHVPLPMFVGLVLLLALGQLWQLTLQPAYGVCIAKQSYGPLATTSLAARLGALVVVSVLAWWLRASGPTTALSWAAAMALGAWMGVAWTRVKLNSIDGPRQTARLAQASPDAAMRSLLKGFALWSLGSAAIQQGVPAIVSTMNVWDYNAFYLAFMLNLVVSGLMGAMGSALIAPMLAQSASSDWVPVVRWLTRGPALITAAVVCMFIALMAWLPPLLAAWTGGALSSPDAVTPYLLALATQTVLRASAVVPAALVAAAGNTQQLTRATWVEIALVLIVAAPAGWAWGAMAFLWTIAAAGGIASMVMMVSAIATLPVGSRRWRWLMSTFVGAQLFGLGHIVWLTRAGSI